MATKKPAVKKPAAKKPAAKKPAAKKPAAKKDDGPPLWQSILFFTGLGIVAICCIVSMLAGTHHSF